MLHTYVVCSVSTKPWKWFAVVLNHKKTPLFINFSNNRRKFKEYREGMDLMKFDEEATTGTCTDLNKV